MHGLQKFIDAVEKDQMKKNLPELKIGMTVKVGVTVVEGNKTRVQPYQGLIIAMHKHALNSTITVRKTFQGVGVERVFPVHSPLITLEPVVSAGVPRVRARCGPAAMRWPAGWRGAPAGRSAPKRARRAPQNPDPRISGSGALTLCLRAARRCAAPSCTTCATAWARLRA
jgi:large subunit ribosomal protein L19